MKTLFTLLATLTALNAFAQSEPALVDVPSDDMIAQSLEINGKPGVLATATLVKSEGEDIGTIMITHQVEYDIRHFVGAMSDSLFTINPNLPGYTVLEKNAAGSLLIKSTNDSTGRERWSRTLTVAYRDNQYKIIGFTYSSIDTISNKKENCDYNLQTRKGKNNGKSVSISTRSIAFNGFMDTEKHFTCKGW